MFENIVRFKATNESTRTGAKTNEIIIFLLTLMIGEILTISEEFEKLFKNYKTVNKLNNSANQ